MNRKEAWKRTCILCISLLGLCIQTAIYAYTWIAIYHMKLAWHNKFTFRGHLLMIFVYFVLLFFFTSTYGGFKVGYLKPWDVFFSQVFALVCVSVISYFQISLMEIRLVRGIPMIRMVLFQILCAGIWTYFGNACYRLFFPPRKLLLIYGDYPIDDILTKFGSRKDKYSIEDCVHMSDGEDAIVKKATNGSYDGVVIWDVPTAIRNRLLKLLYSHNVRIYMMPKISDVIVKGSDSLHLFDTPIFLTREYSLKVEQRIMKRIVDIVCSILLAILTSPIMLITAIAIKLYDGGPVLYTQVRCTLNGKEFRIMKFRSMKVDAEKDGVARLASKNDQRITPIGKFIRAVRIDELPQLFNIIKGEMSFIGPRPERPEIIEKYMETMPEFAFRMKVKAGLAGYAQVFGKYNTTPYDKLKLDLSYIENYSIWLDFKLMLLTLKILLTPESTEGVDENQITATKEEGSGKEGSGHERSEQERREY